LSSGHEGGATEQNKDGTGSHDGQRGGGWVGELPGSYERTNDNDYATNGDAKTQKGFEAAGT